MEGSIELSIGVTLKRDHLTRAGDAGIRLSGCGVPSAGAGVFQDCQFGGELDAAGAFEK